MTHRVVVAALALALLAALIYVLPPRLAQTDGTVTAAERLKAENDVRTTLLQALAAAFLAAGLYFTARTFDLNREGQITERFTRAVDQLGDNKIEVRIGGIYALERIARDSRRDHAPILEILTSYIRQRASRAADSVDDEHRETRSSGSPASADVQPEFTVLGMAGPRPTADIQAALTVLSRRNVEHEVARRGEPDPPAIDLSDTDLRGANLRHASLRNARFIKSDLRGANLENADLRGATVFDARLGGAILADANLSHARLSGADFKGTLNRPGVYLAGEYGYAALSDTNFTRAIFTSTTCWPPGFDPEKYGAIRIGA